MDLNYFDRVGLRRSPSRPVADSLILVARSGALTANLFYSTPHGARAIYVLNEPIGDRAAYCAASAGALALAARDLGRIGLLATLDTKGRVTNGYQPNPGVMDLAHIFFTPLSTVHGRTRSAEVIIVRRTLYPVDLLREAVRRVSLEA